MKTFTEYAQARNAQLGYATELDEGLGQAIAQTAGNLASGIGRFAKQAWGGAAAGAGQFANALNGPEAKFKAALTSLQSLQQILSDPKMGLDKMPGLHGGPLANEISGMVKQLTDAQKMIPQYQATQASNKHVQTSPPPVPTPGSPIAPVPAVVAPPPVPAPVAPAA